MVPYECMHDFNPEDCTTFWTSAMYFVTDGSTPTTVREGEKRGRLGTRQKSAMQWRDVRSAAMRFSSVDSIDLRPDQRKDGAALRVRGEPCDWPGPMIWPGAFAQPS